MATIGSKKLAPLLSEYTSVKNVYPAKFNTELWAPASPDYVSPTEFSNDDAAVAEEFKWLDKCTDILSELDHTYRLMGFTSCITETWHTNSIRCLHYHPLTSRRG